MDMDTNKEELKQVIAATVSRYRSFKNKITLDGTLRCEFWNHIECL